MDDLAQTSSARPTRDDLVASAALLADEFGGRAAECEKLRRIPDENITALKAAGLVRVCMPKEFGGYEMGWDVFCEVIMELAKGCASTAWVYTVYGEHAYRIGQYPIDAQRDVWADGPDVFVSSGNSSDSVLEPADGGYRLSGRFNFSSGCDHAAWHITGSLKARRQLLYRASDRTIDDNWRVAGLAGTGSKDVIVDSVFVPENHTYPMGRGSRFNDGPLWRLPQWSVLPFDLASVPVGIAEGVIERFTDWMKERASRFGDKVADFQSLQLRVAESTAEVHTAREIILSDLRESMEMLEDSDELTVEMMNRNKRDMAFACRLSTASVDRLFYAAGAASLFNSNYMQRAFRDVHAGAAQLALNWDVNGTDYGRVMLGLDPLSPRK